MRDNKGFTLIELLIVVVIIGILAAIAIPKFSATREKAYISAMKSDLKNLATQQEIFYSDGNFSYSSDQAALEFTPSDGVTMTIVVSASGDGWSGSAVHTGTTVVCDIYYGDATPTPNALGPGALGCA